MAERTGAPDTAVNRTEMTRWPAPLGVADMEACQSDDGLSLLTGMANRVREDTYAEVDSCKHHVPIGRQNIDME